MALTGTQAAQAPAANICTQITLKVCFPIFTPLRGLNGGQVSGIRFFFLPSGFAGFLSGRREMSARGREAPRLWQEDASEGKAAEAGDLLAPGRETRQLRLRCPFHACSCSSLLEGSCPFPKSAHSHLSPRDANKTGCTICGRKLRDCPVINLSKKLV